MYKQAVLDNLKNNIHRTINGPLTHLPNLKLDEFVLDKDIFNKFKKDNNLLRDTLADYFANTDKAKVNAAVSTAQLAAANKALNKAKWRSRLTSAGAGAGATLGGLGGYGVGLGLSRLFLGDKDTVAKDKNKRKWSRILRFGGGALGALSGGIGGHMFLNSRYGVPSIQRSFTEDLNNIQSEANDIITGDINPIYTTNLGFTNFK